MARPKSDYPNPDSSGSRDTSIGSMLTPDLQDWLKLTKWYDIKHREEMLTTYRNTDLNEHKPSTTNTLLLGDTDVSKSPQPMRAASPMALLAPQQGSADAPTPPEGSTGLRGILNSRDTSRIGRARSISPQPRLTDSHDTYRDRGYPLPQEDRSRYHAPDRSPDRPVRPNSRGNPNKEKGDDQRDIRRELEALRAPMPINIGPKGTVRFFVMRSYSWGHVYSSQEDGLWATQPEKVDILRKALDNNMTVVLFFGVNKSHSIQGYAIMRSYPSKDLRIPKWLRSIKWKISDPFQVEWFSTMTIDSDHIAHITNRFNDYLPVTRARNCQEINDSAGREMLNILEPRSMDEYRHARETGSFSA